MSKRPYRICPWRASVWIGYPTLLIIGLGFLLSGCAIQDNLVYAWESKPRQMDTNTWELIGYREAGDDTIRTMIERRAEDEGICLNGEVRILKAEVLSTVSPLIVDGGDKTRPLTVKATVICEPYGVANATQ